VRIAEVSRIGVQGEIADSAMTWIMKVAEDEAEGIEEAEKREENVGCKSHSTVSLGNRDTLSPKSQRCLRQLSYPGSYLITLSPF
jgi:hypothetical protein